ncbi:MAG: hypothetical protein U1F71_16665 [Verrucomicrobiaceae bacterium]
MARHPVPPPTRIKIGGVEIVLRPQPQKGSIPENLLRRAVMKAVASEHPVKKS